MEYNCGVGDGGAVSHWFGFVQIKVNQWGVAFLWHFHKGKFSHYEAIGIVRSLDTFVYIYRTA